MSVTYLGFQHSEGDFIRPAVLEGAHIHLETASTLQVLPLPLHYCSREGDDRIQI